MSIQGGGTDSSGEGDSSRGGDSGGSGNQDDASIERGEAGRRGWWELGWQQPAARPTTRTTSSPSWIRGARSYDASSRSRTIFMFKRLSPLLLLIVQSNNLVRLGMKWFLVG